MATNNLIFVPSLLRGSGELRYPGRKKTGGVIQSLSSYMEDVALSPSYHGNNTFENLSPHREEYVWLPDGAFYHYSLDFRIDRHIKWNKGTWKLHPFTYSVHAYSEHIVEEEAQDNFKSNLEADLLGVGGFMRKGSENETGWFNYENHERNVSVMLNFGYSNFYFDIVPTAFLPAGLINGEEIVGIELERKPKPTATIYVGTIKESKSLREVIDEFVPAVVRVYNNISPQKKLYPDVVAKSTEIALERDRIMPHH